jgi:hypothetical protein
MTLVIMWRAPVGIQRFIFHNFMYSSWGPIIGPPDLSQALTPCSGTPEGHIQVLIPVAIFHMFLNLKFNLANDNYVCLYPFL